MKRILKLSLVLTVFLTILSSYAIDGKGDYILYIKTGNGKVISFTLDTLQKSNFTIYDDNNNLLYKGESSIDKLEISKTLSLEEFPAGTYYLEVQDNLKKVKHEIIVTGKKIAKSVKTNTLANESPAFRR